MKRVAVIGSPGAGKSTFCRKLSEKTGLPIYHIDAIYLKKPDYYDKDRERLRNEVLDIIKKQEWIIDGNYTSTFQERFDRADVIIFFDVPKRTAFKGVLQRRIMYHNKKRPDTPDDWKERLSWDFMKFVWDFHKDKKQRLKAALQDFPDKEILVFKSRKQADKYLKQFK